MPIDPVVIRFAAAGVQDVGKAIATVNDQLGRFEQRHTTAARRGKDDRVRAAKDEAKEKLKAEQTVAKQVEKSERDKIRHHNASLAQLKRVVAQMTREETSAEREKLRAVERAEAEKDRIRKQAAAQAGRYAARMVAEEQRAADRSARTRSRVLSGALRGGGTLGRLAGGAVSLAGAGLGIGGGLFVADAARQQLSADKAAAQLINSATVGGVRPGVTARQLTVGAGQISAELGIDKTELIAGMQNYVAKSADVKGGLDTGPESLARFFAKVSTATGSSIGDITGMAGILRAQNPNLGPKEMKQMVLDTIEQGKAGAVEIQDLASLAGGLASTRGLYQGSATENQRKLIALAQVTRTEGSSAEEAMIGVKDLGSEAVKKAAHEEAPQWLKDAVDSKSGLIKGGPEQLIEAALKGTGGNLGSLIKIFDAKGARAFERLAPVFRDAGGGDKGIAAVRAVMAPIMGAKGSEPRLDAMLKEVMDTPTQKFAVALDKVKNSLEERMEPALEKFADILSKPDVQKGIDSFIDGVAGVAKFMAENPFTGIGAIVLASVAKDIAGAAIGEAVKGVLLRLLGGGGGAPVPGGGGGGGGAAAGIVGAGVAATAAGISVMDVVFANKKGQAAGAYEVDTLVGNIQRGADPGGKNAKAAITNAQALAKMSGQDVGNALLNPVSLIGQATGLLSKGEGVLGGKDSGGREKEQAQARVLLANIDRINAALAASAKTLQSIASSKGVVSNAPVTSIGQRSAM